MLQLHTLVACLLFAKQARAISMLKQ